LKVSGQQDTKEFLEFQSADLIATSEASTKKLPPKYVLGTEWREN